MKIGKTEQYIIPNSVEGRKCAENLEAFLISNNIHYSRLNDAVVIRIETRRQILYGENNEGFIFDNRKTMITPCDYCRFNPPGSGDGKPCTMCPAELRTEGEEG